MSSETLPKKKVKVNVICLITIPILFSFSPFLLVFLYNRQTFGVRISEKKVTLRTRKKPPNPSEQILACYDFVTLCEETIDMVDI